jgi:hypothetical protein
MIMPSVGGVMFEVAAVYIGLTLGKKLLDRTGDDIAGGFEKGLVRLYNWAKGKLTSRTGERALAQVEKDPEGDDQQELLADALADAVEGDEAATAELAAMIAELDKLRPPGLVLRGSATSEELHGEQVGVKVSGQLPAGSSVDGITETGTVHQDGKNIGIEYRSGA